MLKVKRARLFEFGICLIVVFKLSSAANFSIINNSEKEFSNDYGKSTPNSRSKDNGNNGLRNLAGTQSTSEKDIHFHLYSDASHPNSFHEIIVNDVSTLENVNFSSGRIKFLGPGFSGSRFALDNLKDAYLKAGVTNVVIMDYKKLVTSTIDIIPVVGFIGYFAALRNVPIIGARGAEFLNFLVKNNKIKDAGGVHILGESLGAHIGYAITRMAHMKYGLTVGRLTGLDTAGPFNNKLGKHKFSKKYAKYVDVIHTDIDGFGTPESLGHADFYVNGGLGKSQPDCKFLGPILVIPCAHGLASHLFILSVSKEKEFYGCPCKSSNLAIIPCGKNTKCDKPVLMGENTPIGARGNYYVKVATKVIGFNTYIEGLTGN